MVTTFLPATADRLTWQDLSALPSMCTVQAPHSPAPQPYFVPVRPTWSRIAHSSGVFGSAPSETGLLLRVNEIMVPPDDGDLGCPAPWVSARSPGIFVDVQWPACATPPVLPASLASPSCVSHWKNANAVVLLTRPTALQS